MSHPSRVRGLKLTIMNMTDNTIWSHPSRVRGLKLLPYLAATWPNMSHPSRVRGLKQLYCGGSPPPLWVAPLAGAWIETKVIELVIKLIKVAPLAGAWIETNQP